MTLPELRLADWRATKDTLHLYCQIAGKIRLAATTPRNHWWNAPLYVDVRGLTTRRLHHCGTTFEITIDFTDHALVVRTADGRTRSFGLGSGLPVADFDARIHAILGELGIDVDIKEEPFGVPTTLCDRCQPWMRRRVGAGSFRDVVPGGREIWAAWLHELKVRSSRSSAVPAWLKILG
jgi:hypothetical protein